MTNPKSADYVSFEGDNQLLVDAAFISYSLLQPGVWDAIFKKLPTENQEALIDGFLATRKIKPYPNNWLLFSAMVELAIEKSGEAKQDQTIDYALQKHNEWYKGDGIYGDGPAFHADYYNSFVIHPFLDFIIKNYKQAPEQIKLDQPVRSARYAEILLRQIMPDGSYPLIGRSICYRCGAFQHLANVAFNGTLPPHLDLAAVRTALGATIAKTLAPSSYDKSGWLVLGVHGHQPSLAEDYISTGSLYLASSVFSPLGLGPDHAFWTSASNIQNQMPNALWTNQSYVPKIDYATKK
jgi:hypothetical protein